MREILSGYSVGFGRPEGDVHAPKIGWLYIDRKTRSMWVNNETPGDTEGWVKLHQDEVNIVHCGADKDAEDNTTAIERAIFEVSEGGTIFIPEGDFRIRSKITLSKRVRMKGPGRLVETITLAPMIHVTADGCELEDVTLESVDSAEGWSSTTATIQSRAAVLVEADNVRLHRVKVRNKTYGFFVRANDCDVSECEIENDWITTALSNFHIAFGCTIAKSGSASTGGKVQGCTITGFGSAIGTGNAAEDVCIQFNTCRGQQDNGIYLSSALRASVIGNKIKSVVATGIKARGNECAIIGNNIYDCRTGIAVTSLAVQASEGTAERVYSDLEGANFNGFGHVIKGNTVHKANIFGIALDRVDDAGGNFYYLHDCLCDGNTLVNCGDPANGLSTPAAIRAFGHGHSITENKIFSTLATDYGILVTGSGAIRPKLVKVTGNKINAPSIVRGIAATACDNPLINDNMFEAIGSFAIALNGCTSPRIIDNIAPGMTIRTDGTASTDVYLDGNDCEFLNFQTTPTGKTVVSRSTATIFGDQRESGFVYRDNWNRTLFDEVVIGAQRHTAGLSFPTTGTWDRGDVCYNTNPDFGDPIAWQTVSSGGSGNWYPVGLVGIDYAGSGSPEGVVSAPVGARYMNKSGGAGTTLYVKESGGSGNTGWRAI